MQPTSATKIMIVITCLSFTCEDIVMVCVCVFAIFSNSPCPCDVPLLQLESVGLHQVAAAIEPCVKTRSNIFPPPPSHPFRIPNLVLSNLSKPFNVSLQSFAAR
jgi:hypothetical protein